ncbi:DUF6685 family protein [Actinobacillus pleuropneumoniae]|uniref:DUF6685 family protein n=1 Tax=Actinobacillus pleuropneumoniae TaxID=715 RepID=UPI003B0262E0
MMFYVNSKLISVATSIESVLRTQTPLLIVKFNLQHILHNNRCDFKPQLKSDDMLGAKRYFWHYFSGHFIEWYYSKHEHSISSKINTEIPTLLQNLISHKAVPDWKCDIQTITNISSSKSDLSSLTNLDELVIQDSQELISEISQKNLDKNMAHYESKIFHDPSVNVSCELWSGTFTWNNTGGSHHFAAARYIASQLEKPINLISQLTIEYLDKDVMDILFSKYHIFIFSGKNTKQYNLLRETLMHSKVPFVLAPIDAMFSMNEDYSSLKLLAFYNSGERAFAIRELCKNSALLDLNMYFNSLYQKQLVNEFKLRDILN